MFHRLREYIDIKKCGIAQLSYAITYSRGGGYKYTALHKKIRKNRGDECLAMGILQGSRGCMLLFCAAISRHDDDVYLTIHRHKFAFLP